MVASQKELPLRLWSLLGSGHAHARRSGAQVRRWRKEGDNGAATQVVAAELAIGAVTGDHLRRATGAETGAE